MKKTFHLSERSSCKLAGISRSGFRYHHKSDKDKSIRLRLLELAKRHPSYGYLFLHSILKTEGLVCNRKRTYRIYKELGLQVRTRKRKKLVRPRLPMVVPSSVDMRWSMDFVSDQLANGRRFRVLNVIDDYSRQVIGQLVSFSINGRQVADFLDRLIDQRKKPNQITCDNGTEFTCKTMYYWQQQTGVKLGFIQPGKPIQNAFVESLNGKFRSECLNQYWFKNIEEAKELIMQWRNHYNTKRPHSSLNYLSPVDFVKQAA